MCRGWLYVLFTIYVIFSTHLLNVLVPLSEAAVVGYYGLRGGWEGQMDRQRDEGGRTKRREK